MRRRRRHSADDAPIAAAEPSEFADDPLFSASKSSILPPHPSFAGHQTFTLRSGWLKKGLDALQTEAVGGSRFFAREDALVTLGVGKNMVQSIRHWLLATGMAVEAGASGNARGIEPTLLGASLLGRPGEEGWDAFLEDAATPWLLHWRLAGPGSSSFTWVWAFHLFREWEFTRDALTEAVTAGAAARVPRPPSRETVARDVDCLVHTYGSTAAAAALAEEGLDCPLRELGLIRPAFESHFRFEIGPKPSLPPALFAFALVEYWKRRYTASARTLTVRDVAYGEGSPGITFKLDEESVLEYLDTLSACTGGALRFEDTVLARQVIRDADAPLNAMELLQSYYARQSGGVAAAVPHA